MKTVKQIFKTGMGLNADEINEATTLIGNVKMLGQKAGIIYTDGTIENMTIEDLRRIQDELIPLYNATFKKEEL